MVPSRIDRARHGGETRHSDPPRLSRCAPIVHRARDTSAVTGAAIAGAFADADGLDDIAAPMLQALVGTLGWESRWAEQLS